MCSGVPPSGGELPTPLHAMVANYCAVHQSEQIAIATQLK